MCRFSAPVISISISVSGRLQAICRQGTVTKPRPCAVGLRDLFCLEGQLAGRPALWLAGTGLRGPRLIHPGPLGALPLLRCWGGARGLQSPSGDRMVGRVVRITEAEPGSPQDIERCTPVTVWASTLPVAAKSRWLQLICRK